MDFDLSQFIPFLAPLLPYLLQGANDAARAAAGRLGERLTDETLDGLKKLAGKILQRSKGKAAEAAIQQAVENPQDLRAIGRLEVHLETLLRENPDLLVEAQAVVGPIFDFSVIRAEGGSAAVGGNVIGSNLAIGNKNVIFGQDAHGNVAVNVEVHTASIASVNPQALLESYLSHLILKVGWLDPTLIDRTLAGDATRARLSLAKIYTELDVIEQEDVERDEKKRSYSQTNGELPERLKARKPGEENRLPVVRLLNRYKKLAILGDAGAGKSTLVNFLTLCMAGQALKNEEANLQTLGKDWQLGWLLPVRVVLRSFVAHGLPKNLSQVRGDDLWRFIKDELGETLADFIPLLDKQLKEVGGLILFDGFDEVPEAEQRREQVTQAIQDFVSRYPKCHVILTSRTYAWQRQNWNLPDFHEAVLAPFSDEQINTFVERWYAHIATLRRGEMTAEESSGQATLLKNAIQHTPGLQELARRPLLLTLIASLHAWRKGKLPEQRERLYNEALDLLLFLWEQPKIERDEKGNERVVQPAVQEWLKAPRNQLLKAIEKLGFEAHSRQKALEGTADISEMEVVQALWEIRGNPDLRQERLIEFIRDRAGLLIPHGLGVYTFPHRTFQEYLAARHLTTDDWPQKIAELVHGDPERWREVVLLAAFKAREGTDYAVWGLLEALVPSSPGEMISTNQAWAAALAGRILVENELLQNMPAYHQEKVSRIRGWLVRLIEAGLLPAVERAAAGDTLARLGDPRPGCSFLPAGEKLGGQHFLFCEIPPGPFVMGSNPQADPEAFKGEQPQFTYTRLERPYYLARYPVTNAQFQAFLEDPQGYERRDWWTEEGWEWKKRERRAGPPKAGGAFDLPNHPVINVTWYEAYAFTRWLDHRFREEGFRLQVWGPEGVREVSLDPREWQVRLPTEAEWEKAARGERGGIYPWGGDLTPNHANYSDTGLGATSAVGCFPRGASPYGALDLSGNVWEWCLTKWRDNYRNYEKVEDNDPTGSDARVRRGGAFLNAARDVRCAYRDWYHPDIGWDNGGFRVVVGSSPVSLQRRAGF